MAKLRDKERREVVKRLACFEQPAEVQDYVSEEFDKEPSIRQIIHYDPTKSEHTGEKWEELFERTREEFLSDLDTIPLSHRAVRLRELTALYEKAKKDDEVQVAARMLKQAAKEVGDKFTNRQEVEHEGGFMVQINPPESDD